MVVTQIMVVPELIIQPENSGWYAAGPLAFLVFAVFRVRRHMQSGDMPFIYTSRPSFTEFRTSLSKGKSIVAKFTIANAYLTGVCAHGCAYG